MSENETFILKPKDVEVIVKTADKTLLTDLFESPLEVVVESVTGWLASGPKEWALASGHIVQAALKVRLFQQVAAEIEEFRKKGRIAQDFGKRENEVHTWVELFKFIDEETPDQERLDALKAMFFGANRIGAADGEKILTYQLFQIAKGLKSNELLVLKMAYELHGQQIAVNQSGGWWGLVAERLGHGVDMLVHLAERALVENELLGQVNASERRLTLLGVKFCENIKQYRIDRKS
jgi:hypothetical protein